MTTAATPSNAGASAGLPEVADAPLAERRDMTQFVARHLIHFLLTHNRRWQRTLGLDRLDTLILHAAISANLAQIPVAEPGLDADDALRRPISVASLADSTGIAYETVRRRATRLARVGSLRPTGDGYIAPRAFTTAAPLSTLPAHDRAAVIALVTAMHAQGYAIAPALLDIDTAEFDDQLARLALTCSLRCQERLHDYGGLVMGPMWLAILAANIGHLLDNTDLSLRHTGAELLPDDARRPITLRQLAREMGRPFETVRRHAATMMSEGMIAATENGVIVPMKLVDLPEHRHVAAALGGCLRRMIEDIVRLYVR